MKLFLNYDEMENFNKLRNKTIDELFSIKGTNTIDLDYKYDALNNLLNLYESALQILISKFDIYLSKFKDNFSVSANGYSNEYTDFYEPYETVKANINENDYNILNESINLLKGIKVK